VRIVRTFRARIASFSVHAACTVNVDQAASLLHADRFIECTAGVEASLIRERKASRIVLPPCSAGSMAKSRTRRRRMSRSE
jgi:hypothetical protein